MKPRTQPKNDRSLLFRCQVSFQTAVLRLYCLYFEKKKCTKMNEEIDESEFYHQDFTTASEWEVFMARMEEIIHSWNIEDNKERQEIKLRQEEQELIREEEKLKETEQRLLQENKGELKVTQDKKSNDEKKVDELNLSRQENKVKEVDKSNFRTWKIRSEQLPFADVDFVLHFYEHFEAEEYREDEDQPEKNPIDNDYDFVLNDGTFTENEHSIAYWYGLKKFIILTPLIKTAILSESRIKILISSAHIVTGNLNSNIPIFIQIRERWQKCFLGVYEGNGIRTNFEMIHLKKGPQHCQYLTGLLDLFKTKILSPVSLDPILVSVRLTYQATDFGSFTWKQKIQDFEANNFYSSSLCALPFGVSLDPVKIIYLKASWSHLTDHMIIDSENYTDFDPMQAPKWTLCSSFNDEPICFLSECLLNFLYLIKNNSTVYDILGDYAVSPSPEIQNPLDLLTEHKVPTISSILKRAGRNSLTRNRNDVAPLSEDVLVPMLYYLFPDAEYDSPCPYTDKAEKDRDPYNLVRFICFKT